LSLKWTNTLLPLVSDRASAPNMASQRTRRPRFRSGRSRCSLGSPLTRRPLGVGRLLILATLAMGLAPMRTAAQNLLQNGGFASDLSSWQLVGVQGGSALWSPTDSAASPSSGSALLVNDQPCVPQGSGFACPFPGLSQCVGVVGGANYSIGYSALIPAGQKVSGLAFLQFHWYSGNNCDAGSLFSPGFGSAPAVGTWGEEVRGAIAPAAARSLQIQISAIRSELPPQGNFQVRFDNVFVNGPGRIPEGIPTLSASALGSLLLLLAITGSVLVSRGDHA